MTVFRCHGREFTNVFGRVVELMPGIGEWRRFRLERIRCRLYRARDREGERPANQGVWFRPGSAPSTAIQEVPPGVMYGSQAIF